MYLHRGSFFEIHFNTVINTNPLRKHKLPRKSSKMHGEAPESAVGGIGWLTGALGSFSLSKSKMSMLAPCAEGGGGFVNGRGQGNTACAEVWTTE